MRLKEYSSPVIVALDALDTAQIIAATVTVNGAHAEQMPKDVLIEHASRQLSTLIAHELMKKQLTRLNVVVNRERGQPEVDHEFIVQFAIMSREAHERMQQALAFIVRKEQAIETVSVAQATQQTTKDDDIELVAIPLDKAKDGDHD